MTDFTSWVCDILQNKFADKIDASVLISTIESDPGNIGVFAHEIQQAIELFNTQIQIDDSLINAKHLASILSDPLPRYEEIMAKLQTDQDLQKQVITELTTSSYFREVYEISDPLEHLHNIMILLYRTSLLHMYPMLREKGAQISSTIEEMACVLALNGAHTHLFEATKRWIKNWKDEEFSSQLVDKLSEAKLL
jgi:hypothetical protein